MLFDFFRSDRRLRSIEANLAVLVKQGLITMATIQDVQDTLDQIKTATGDYITKRDAIDVTKDATIADLTAQLAAGTTTPADVQAGIDAALQKAKDELALLTPPIPAPVPADPTAAV